MLSSDQELSPFESYQHILEEKQIILQSAERSGLLSPSEKTHQLTVLQLLREWTPNLSTDAKSTFESVKVQFDKQCKKRQEAMKLASEALEYAFTFMEDAFREGQEMVIFVTELTMNSKAASFITEVVCERYFTYCKSLCIGSRRAALLNEL